METTFKKTIALLKEAGIDYKDIITPFWSEEQRGVVVPAIGKVIPLFEPTGEEMTWEEALDLAKSLDQQLPTVEEWHEIRRHRNVINEILTSKGGDTITAASFWTSTEYNRHLAMYVNFSSGYTTNGGKYNTHYCRPLAAFNGFDKEEREGQA